MKPLLLLLATLATALVGCSSSTSGPDPGPVGNIYVSEVIAFLPEAIVRGVVMTPEGSTVRVFDSIVFVGVPRAGMMLYHDLRDTTFYVARTDGSMRVRIQRDTFGLLFGQFPDLSRTGSTVALLDVKGGVDSSSSWYRADVVLVSASDGTRRTIATGADANTNVTFSPDGGTVAYVGADHRLYSVATTGGAPRLLAPLSMEYDTLGSQMGVTPYWSPDGSRILVHGAYGWMIVPTDGSAAATDPPFGPDGNHASWSPDGRRIAIGVGDSIAIVEPDFTSIRTYWAGVPNGEVAMPQWSPDGRSILFQAYSGFIYGPCGILDVASGSHRFLTGQSIYAFWER